MTDKEMIEDQGRWPQWPFLPMKKSDGSGECGCIIAAEGLLTTVVKVNLWDIRGVLREVIEKHEKVEYPSIEAMLEDGWIVD